MKKCIFIGGISTVLMMIIIFIIYPHLPDQIPVHWNLQGIDRYAHRSHIILSPLLVLGLNGLLLALPYLDPKRNNYQKFHRTYQSFIWLFNIFIQVFFISVVYAAFYPNQVNMNYLVQISIGVLLLFMGNMMPRIKQNYFMGIKTPWALADERVWNKTHRLSGKLWFVGGICLILVAFLPSLSIWLNVGIFTLLIGIPFIYSYIVYKDFNKKENSHD